LLSKLRRDSRMHHETYLLLMADFMQAAPSWLHIAAVKLHSGW
jgi:hypothetical protein